MKLLKRWFKKVLLLFLQMRITRFRAKGRRLYVQISTPTHGNLGDQAITFAEQRMIASVAGAACVEIPAPLWLAAPDQIKKIIAPQDVIVIDGGGNIGTLWPAVEQNLRRIINSFSRNKIIIFPQTAYFEDSAFGREMLNESVKIYSAHPDLTILARDKRSYELLKEHFKQNKILFTPDIVLSLHPGIKQRKRTGALVCFRSDGEKVVESGAEEFVVHSLRQAGWTVEKTTTVLDKQMVGGMRKMYLRKKWKEFSGAQLIVTDRLHGMIFAAITGTPCIVFDNVSHKVKEGAQWLAELKYIRYCEDVRTFETTLMTMETKKEYRYPQSMFEKEFKSIHELLCVSRN